MQKLTFGTTPQDKQEATCAFQCIAVGRDNCVRSIQCHQPALENGWCPEHQHAQQGMDLGEKLG